MNGILSDKCVVESGVPQGSILGPVLFIAFTTDFSKHFKDTKITAYADDTQLLVVGKNIREMKEKVEQTIAKAQAWFSNNSLKINPTKSEVMVFGLKRNQEEDIHIKVVDAGTTTTIKTAKSMKILGVTIDQHLSWDQHIKNIKPGQNNPRAPNEVKKNSSRRASRSSLQLLRRRLGRDFKEKRRGTSKVRELCCEGPDRCKAWDLGKGCSETAQHDAPDREKEGTHGGIHSQDDA